VVGNKCVVYGARLAGEVGSSRSVGGRMNVRIVLSALEVNRLVPSGVLKQGRSEIDPRLRIEVVTIVRF
jgi:hypothetical protein